LELRQKVARVLYECIELAGRAHGQTWAQPHRRAAKDIIDRNEDVKKWLDKARFFLRFVSRRGAE
jgi:hypothetical protein